ncbi:thymidine phosphorylase [Candidatus Kaiserbacteria bacterium RIFCSPHIGHO2_01_FULL_56_24]|uniref:Thymidine phosphorylase n=1 Tax=Candidatus Kaiserbacteria bacterium RIFCSPHIGHO2_01_FULL_56_24 TaxID=1798487 RepID=A0A1F6DEC7_9BACT|nr:MAG: thymidine phosphorylase [Candidatus Kaiserbacteria bacterium RIFCSPHIGHO2_01_FULL_56_24]
MNDSNTLKFKSLGIYTQHEHVVYMREDCHICISEGFQALTRLRITKGDISIVASLNVVRSDMLALDEIGLSEAAVKALTAKEGDEISISHLEPIDSLRHLRAKIFDHTLDYNAYGEIITDIVKGEYSNIHLSAFITACAGGKMNIGEISDLTKAMIASGERLRWGTDAVVDKHCIGGLPGNRTTPIVVSIVAAFGLTMPKTSSRAITSPAGTADTMEVMTNVDLSAEQIKKVVERENGCIVWSGTAQLSPADDILIRIERALDIDSAGQLIASILSKKASAGSRYVVIDIPVGETAKIRTKESAEQLKKDMEIVADSVELKIKVIITDGSQPVGRGIGPALEARDVLDVLRNRDGAPHDLKERALLLAGELLELSGKIGRGEGSKAARELLESGKAYEKFKAICEAQGRFTEPELAPYSHSVTADRSGIVSRIDNRKIAQLAKLSGAPRSKKAGVLFCAPLGKRVETGDVLYTIYAESEGSLRYALDYHHANSDIVTIQ